MGSARGSISRSNGLSVSDANEKINLKQQQQQQQQQQKGK